MSGSRISSGCAAMTAPNMYKVVHEPTAKHFDEFDLPRVVWGIKGAHYHRYHNNSSPVLETAGGWHAGVAGSVVCSAEDEPVHHERAPGWPPLVEEGHDVGVVSEHKILVHVKHRDPRDPSPL